MLKTGALFEENVILAWMRDRFFQELASDLRNPKADLQDCLVNLKLNPYFTFPAIALLEPAVRFLESKDKSAHAERLRECLQRQLKDGSVVFLDEEGRPAVLFSWTEKHRIEPICAETNRQLGERLTVGVGKPCSHLNDIGQSYRQAAGALQHKFYRGAGEVIYYSELGKFETLQHYPVELEEELFSAFQAAESSSDIEQAVHTYYERATDGKLIARQCLYDLTVKLLIGLEKRALAKAENVGSYQQFDVMCIVNMDTMEAMKRYVMRFLWGLKEVVAHNQKESQRSIIKKTIHYMEQECQYASLQSVAQKVYMTPTYLSLLFKLNTGKTFIEHLTDIRMDKAKDMLKSTHFKNYEVAERVGYQDPRYFSQIFKKKVGLSPSEYRETVGR